MESGNSPKPPTNAQPGTRSLPFEIDLNETPLCSPHETLASDEDSPETEKDAGLSGEVRRTVCSSCGKTDEVEGDMLFCGGCERGFHMRCLGTKVHQKPREWKCFKCLLSNGSERLRGGVGLLDINASPPQETEGEGLFGDLQNSEHGVLARVAEQNIDKEKYYKTRYKGGALPHLYVTLYKSDEGNREGNRKSHMFIAFFFLLLPA